MTLNGVITADLRYLWIVELRVYVYVVVAREMTG